MKPKKKFTGQSWSSDKKAMDAKSVQVHLTTKLREQMNEPELDWVRQKRLKRERMKTNL